MQPELLSPPLINQPNLVQEESNETIEETDALDKVARAYDASKRNQEKAMTVVRELWQLWRFYKSAGSYIKVFNPIGYALTIGILSKMFVRPPEIVLTARQGGWKWLAKILQTYLDIQFDNPDAEEPMSEEFISFITELLVTGTAVYKVHWCTKYGMRYAEEMNPETGQYERIGKEVIDYDAPKFEHIPLENFYYQPGAKSVDDSTYVIFEKWVDQYELEQLGKLVDPMTGEPVYRYIPEAIAAGPGGATFDPNAVKEARSSHTSTTEAQEDHWHLLEYMEDDRLIVVIDNRWVSRDEANPFDHGRKPYGAMQYVKVPHEFYGIGALEPVVDLQKAVNVTLTQRLEYVSNLLTQQFAVVGDGNDEDGLIEGSPIIHVTSADAITPLQKGSVPQASFLTSEEILGDIERTMGISGYQVGAPQAANDQTDGTLGGIERITQEAQTRFDMTMRRFEVIVLKKTAKLFLDLDRQYFSSTEQKIILVNNNNQQFPVPLTRELFQLTDWLIDIVPGSTGIRDKQRKAESFARWVQFATGMMPMQIDRQAVVLEAAEYEDIDNPERFILPVPQLPPEQAMLGAGGPTSGGAPTNLPAAGMTDGA